MDGAIPAYAPRVGPCLDAAHAAPWRGSDLGVLQAAGVRYRPPHVLRHAFASLLLAQGESLAYVMDQLGHASIRLTVDLYGHLVPGGNRAAVDKLDDVEWLSAPDGQLRPTVRNLPATGSGKSAIGGLS